MTVRSYTVEGMTCSHCEASVAAEVSKLAGVTGVVVDVPGKTLTVSGESVEDAAVAAAVDEAGYAVVV